MTPAENPAVSAGSVAGIILAAGASSRMGVDKMWAPLDGMPVVGWSIKTLASMPAISSLVVAVPLGVEARMRDLLQSLGVHGLVVTGGAERQDSVRSALEACPGADWVAIHDGARPLVTADIVERGLAAARDTGAAIAAVPVTDTIKVVAAGRIVATPNRGTLWAAQTPQVFRREIILRAHERAAGTASDDAALVEALGIPVRVFQGAYGNIKVTTPVDLQIAATLLTAARSSLERGPTEDKDDDGGRFAESSVHRQLSGRDRP
jgi:2-C-methyl-D-erythritol 4-phosphate cytidylyltransferase